MFWGDLSSFHTAFDAWGCFTSVWCAIPVQEGESDEESIATEVAEFDDDIPDELAELKGRDLLSASTVDELVRRLLREPRLEHILLCLLSLRHPIHTLKEVTVPLIEAVMSRWKAECKEPNFGRTQVSIGILSGRRCS